MIFAHDVSQLIGETMRSVTRHGNEEIVFDSVRGVRWAMYYEQDCCASCSIEEVIGDLDDLVGVPIAMAEVVTNSDDPPLNLPPQNYDESFTWTFYKLATARGYVTVRWFGSSNGYYSETASFKRVGLINIDPKDVPLGGEFWTGLEVAFAYLGGYRSSSR